MVYNIQALIRIKFELWNNLDQENAILIERSL